MPVHSVTFTQSHRDIFRRVSSDCNPLHCDAAYAKHTPFGEVILHGMAAIIYALGLIAGHPSIRLTRIQGQFRKPIFLDRQHDIVLDDAQTGSHSVEVRYGAETLARFRAEWSSWDPSTVDRSDDEREIFMPLAIGLDPETPPASAEYKLFSLQSQHLEDFASIFSIGPQFIPKDQLAALMWSSYQIGMVWPGRQALYSNFTMKFSDDVSNQPSVSFDQMDMSIDSRFGLAAVTANKGESLSVSLKALLRPRAVAYSHEEIASSAQQLSVNLDGKHAVVIGGSRGFGFVLARILAHLGADVTVVSRSNIEAVENDLGESFESRGSIRVLQLDASKIESFTLGNFGDTDAKTSVDILVCNASPIIKDSAFNKMTQQEFDKYVSKSLSLYHVPILGLDNALADDATVINISSVYVENIKAGFSHYIAAKSAIEGMTRVLAKEYPNRKFVIFRAPRMLTDQTNVNNDTEHKESAVDVAALLIQHSFATNDPALDTDLARYENLLIAPATN